MDWTGWGQALSGGLIGSVVGWLGAQRAGNKAADAAERLATMEQAAEARHRWETALKARAADVTTALAQMLAVVRRDAKETSARFWPTLAAVTRLRMELGQDCSTFRQWLRDEIDSIGPMSHPGVLSSGESARALEKRVTRLSGVIVGWVWDGMGDWDDARIEEEIQTVHDLFEDQVT